MSRQYPQVTVDIGPYWPNKASLSMTDQFNGYQGISVPDSLFGAGLIF